MSDKGNVKPKEVTVKVVDKEMIVREMVLSQRDFLFETLRQYNIAELVFKKVRTAIKSIGVEKFIKGKIQGKTNCQEEDEHEDKAVGMAIIESLVDIIGKLGSKDLTNLMIKILSTKDNIKKIGEKITDEEFADYIRNNMPWHQEPQVIKAILEVNDIPEILKNYMGIGNLVAGLFQTQKSAQESVSDSE